MNVITAITSFGEAIRLDSDPPDEHVFGYVSKMLAQSRSLRMVADPFRKLEHLTESHPHRSRQNIDRNESPIAVTDERVETKITTHVESLLEFILRSTVTVLETRAEAVGQGRISPDALDRGIIVGDKNVEHVIVARILKLGVGRIEVDVSWTACRLRVAYPAPQRASGAAPPSPAAASRARRSSAPAWAARRCLSAWSPDAVCRWFAG
jgi:hypothetical protein